MTSAELNLVNKVDLRLALAESELQLEKLLDLFLCPLILKLASPDAEVRQAVFRTIQNIFPRITAARTLNLPVQNLLEQAKTPKVLPGADLGSVRLYSLLFLSKGIERLDSDAQAALVPQVIRGISSVSTTVAARLFSILVKLLQNWKAPENGSPEAEKMRVTLGFSENPKDEIFLALKITSFFMLQPNMNPHPAQAPGLSLDDSAFFTKDAGVTYKTYDEITGTKKRLLEFTKNGFCDETLALPLLVASTDALSTIAEDAYARYKKLDVDLESPEFIDKLVSLFLGEGNDILPVKPVLQERILAVFCKSTLVVSHAQIGQLSTAGLLSEYGKLRQTAVAFVRKVTSSTTQAQAQPEVEVQLGDMFSMQVAAKLKNCIISEGWPQMDLSRITNFCTAISLRELQYEALGDVLRHSPALWRDDLTYVKFLYASLEGETSDLISALQSVLSSLSVHLPNLSQNCKNELKVLLNGCLANPRHGGGNLRACKFLAVKYVNCTFTFDDAEARLLCVFATLKENNMETREEAERGLHPYHFNLLRASNTTNFKSSKEYLGHGSPVDFPAFSAMVATIKASIDSADEPLIARKTLGRAMKFALSVLVMQAIRGKTTVIVVDEEWNRRLEKALEVDTEVRQLVVFEAEILSNIDGTMHADNSVSSFPLFETLVGLVFDCFYSQLFGSTVDATDAIHVAVFALLVSLAPPSVVGALSATIPRQVRILQEKILVSKDLRDISNTLGIVATHGNNDVSVSLEIVDTFAKNMASSNDREKYISVTGNILAKLALRKRIQEELVLGVLDQYLGVLGESLQDSRLYDTCIDSLSQVAIFGVLGPELRLSDKVTAYTGEFMATIEAKLKSFHENSVVALSKLALALPSTYATNEEGGEEALSPVEQKIFDTHVSKQIEYIFTCGDALAVLAGGWLAKNLRQSVDIQGEAVVHVPKTTGRLGAVLCHVITATKQTKPALRRAGCIWLLALVQYLPQEPLITEKATDIHAAFMRFLVDRDEMVQEAAVRGLSLVYDLGDGDLKETLVKGLLRSFTDANASCALAAGSVDLDTQLFEKDVLKTHDSSVSTYKDVLALAADVGDPSLVYKLMSLAKSNALWSSRRGMAYGLGSILSKDSLAQMLLLELYLGMRLVPKLYRYRFDPNHAVSLSMNDIWMALISDTPKTVNNHFDAILREVFKGMSSREWRVRQASALALTSLIQMQPMEKYEAKLEDMWNMSFRAMDDIKESVRKEGTTLAKTLARILIRAVDPKTHTPAPKSAKILDHLVPMFMGTKGLLSDVEDVRTFALETTLKLCETGGGLAIRRHVPLLLATFIQLMSTLEPEIVNYLVLNADKYKLNSNDVDARRLQSLGHLPMMHGIETLLGQIDDAEMMREIIGLLKTAVKKSVGLPSKVCGSRVIVSLVAKQPVLAKAHGDALLALSEGQLKDRNATISQTYALAAGHCCRLAGIDAIVGYSEKIAQMYLEGHQPATRKLAAVACEAVGKYGSADKFQRVSSAFLPLVYIGKHDSDREVSAAFDNVWVEYSNGASAVKLYYAEIVAMCEANILCNDYSVRQTMARTIVDVCLAIDTLLAQATESLFAMVLDACKGKSWQGKELVFEALVTLSLASSEYLLAHEQPTLDLVCGTVLTELKRRNKAYQLRVVLSVGKFIKEFPQKRDIVDAYVGTVRLVLADEYWEDADIIPDESSVAVEEFHLKYISNAVNASPSGVFDGDLFALAVESMDMFRNSRHKISWGTCYTFNENFQLFFASWKTVVFNDQQLQAVSKGLSVLTGFTDMYKLEKNAIIFARNTGLSLELFTRHNCPQYANEMVQTVRVLLGTNVSSVARNELTMALS